MTRKAAPPPLDHVLGPAATIGTSRVEGEGPDTAARRTREELA